MLSEEPSVPLALKYIQLIVMAMCVAFAVRQISRRGLSSRQQIMSLVILISLTMCGFLSNIVPWALLKDYNVNMIMRLTAGLGVFYAGLFALSYNYAPAKLRGAVILLGLALVSGYAMQVNEQSIDHLRMNERDRFLASRFVERLSSLPGWSHLRTVVIVGAQENLNRLGIDSTVNGFNQSALLAPWSRIGVISEVSGARLELPTVQDEALAREHARGVKPWPSIESVFSIDDIGVVVMSSPYN